MNQSTPKPNSSSSTSATLGSDDTDIRQQLHTLRDDVKELARVTANAASERVAAAKDRVVGYRDHVEDLAKDNPLRAMLIAAGVGAVLGLILARR